MCSNTRQAVASDTVGEAFHSLGHITVIGYMQVSRRTWREAARFPESGVLPLSLTTQHEEVMGRICFVYGCSHRSDGEKCSFFLFPRMAIKVTKVTTVRIILLTVVCQCMYALLSALWLAKFRNVTPSGLKLHQTIPCWNGLRTVSHCHLYFRPGALLSP